MEMRLEVVPLPVLDVDISKAFYVDQVGVALDHDVEPGNGMRVVQLTSGRQLLGAAGDLPALKTRHPPVRCL